MRLLDAAGIEYIPGEYEVDENNLSGSHAADMMGVEHDSMYKTLVLKGEKKGYLTGYIRGGCAPVGMKKRFPTYIEETAILYDRITVSAGQRGVQISVEPDKLAGYLEAEFAPLI